MKSTLLFGTILFGCCMYCMQEAAAAPHRVQGLLLGRGDQPVTKSIHSNDCECMDSPKATAQCCLDSKGGTSNPENGKCSFPNKDETWNNFTLCCVKNKSSSSCQSNDVQHIQYDIHGHVIS
ncbi:hypothetical protein BJV82DRAFT_621726, partial [Fennellomyces sp. T-0311]